MGCDYSILVKQDFTERTSNLGKTVNKIKKRQEKAAKMIQYFTTLNSPTVEGEKICANLCGQLENLEILLEQIKKVKDREISVSLSVSSSVEEAPRPPLSSDVKEKVEENRKEAVLANSGKGKESRLYTTESIMEDPEIVALISKNRNRLLKKMTK